MVGQKAFKEVSRHVLSPCRGPIRHSDTGWSVAHHTCDRGLLLFFEAKDGKYGEDGSETLEKFIARRVSESEVPCFLEFVWRPFKKNIEYLIGRERQFGAMDVIFSTLHCPYAQCAS